MELSADDEPAVGTKTAVSCPDSPLEPMQTFLDSGHPDYDLVGSPQGVSDTSGQEGVTDEAERPVAKATDTPPSQEQILDEGDETTTEVCGDVGALFTYDCDTRQVVRVDAVADAIANSETANGDQGRAVHSDSRAEAPVRETGEGHMTQPVSKAGTSNIRNRGQAVHLAADEEAGRTEADWQAWDDTKPGFDDDFRKHAKWNGREKYKQFGIDRGEVVTLHLRRPVHRAMLWVTHRSEVKVKKQPINAWDEERSTCEIFRRPACLLKQYNPRRIIGIIVLYLSFQLPRSSQSSP